MEELKKWIEHRICYLREKNEQAIDRADDINDPYFDYIEGQIRALGDILYMLEGKR